MRKAFILALALNPRDQPRIVRIVPPGQRIWSLPTPKHPVTLQRSPSPPRHVVKGSRNSWAFFCPQPLVGSSISHLYFLLTLLTAERALRLELSFCWVDQGPLQFSALNSRMSTFYLRKTTAHAQNAHWLHHKVMRRRNPRERLPRRRALFLPIGNTFIFNATSCSAFKPLGPTPFIIFTLTETTSCTGAVVSAATHAA
jgi:hypothetical protein